MRERQTRKGRHAGSLKQGLGDKWRGQGAEEEVHQVCDCDFSHELTSYKLLLVAMSEYCVFHDSIWKTQDEGKVTRNTVICVILNKVGIAL